MPDARCLHCGRPITYRRLKGRVYKAKYCPGAQCRKAHFRNKHKTDPTPRLPPIPSTQTPKGETPSIKAIQQMTLNEILEYIHAHRFSADTEKWIRTRWEEGNLPQLPKTPETQKETFSSDQPLTDDEQDQILPTVAVELTRLREKNKAVKGASGVLRRRVPEGGGGA